VARAEKQSAPVETNLRERLCGRGHKMVVHLEGEVVWRCPSCWWTERFGGGDVTGTQFDAALMQKLIDTGGVE